MISRNIFLSISPIDHRYYLANSVLFDRLASYISEEANIRYCVKVEIALLKTHMIFSNSANIRNSSLKKYLKDLDSIESKIDPEEIYREEDKTHHNIRALVNVLKKYVPEKLKYLVHLGATSADILDTASAVKYRDVVKEVVVPLLIELENRLIDITLDESKTPQVGRTHGQHAVPITFGFAVAEYVARLGKSVLRISQKADDLKGKLSGAVGAYNAIGLITDDPLEFEKAFLKHFNLEPSEYSNQLVEPEYLLNLLLELNIAFGIIANIADDLRNLQRSEIAEVQEYFSESQVGSSTMPQKRNPWNSEHVKSLWKTFSPRTITFFMDQISEHQRDLTNSASKRFIADYIAGFCAAASRITKVISSLQINRKKMLSNLLLRGDLILSEALYVLLAKSGESDAHELMKQLTLKRDKSNKTLIEIINEDAGLSSLIEKELRRNLKLSGKDFWLHPENYCGIAAKKAEKIALKYKKIFSKL